MESEYYFQFTTQAREDLDEIISYITVDLDNSKAASDLMDQIERTINNLCAFPKIGIIVRNPYLSVSGIRKQPIKNFMLYYFPDDENHRIVILRIVYGMRDADAVVKTLSF